MALASDSLPATTIQYRHALLGAVILECILAALVAGWMSFEPAPPPPPPPAPPMTLQIVDLPTEAPKPKIPTPEPSPKAEAKPKEIIPPKPKTQPKATAKPAPAVDAVVPTPSPPDAPPAPTAVAEAEVAPVVQPQAVASPNTEIILDYEGKARAAIQAAVRFPVAAKALGREGRVRVAFDFVDGQTSNIQVVQPDDLDLFVNAAQMAIQTAPYPTVPAELLHKSMHFLVWVEFLKKRN